jgi:DNA (cytosine-5)-methyltransferase 1
MSCRRRGGPFGRRERNDLCLGRPRREARTGARRYTHCGGRMKTFYEFFCGGGMARAGLGLGWKCLFANDFDSKKAAAYATNWGMDSLSVGDVASISTSEIGGETADLAWASFPCQDLSLAGSGGGLNGERSGSFWSFWKIVRALRAQQRKPRLIVLENVCGTLTSHEGRDFESIAQALTDENYRFGPIVIDAVYFLPQSRPRLFFVAVDQSLDLPEECCSGAANPAWHTPAILRAYNRLPQELRRKWLWWNLPAPQDRLETLENILELKPRDVSWHTADETKKLMSLMTPLNRRKILAAQADGHMRVGTLYKRMRNGAQRAEVRLDGVAGCLRTPIGGSSRQTIVVVEPNSVRTRLLSSRELARLMGLPEKYELPPKYNDTYHLLGDGVVVPVVRHLAAHVLERVLDANSSKALSKAA